MHPRVRLVVTIALTLICAYSVHFVFTEDDDYISVSTRTDTALFFHFDMEETVELQSLGPVIIDAGYPRAFSLLNTTDGSRVSGIPTANLLVGNYEGGFLIEDAVISNGAWTAPDWSGDIQVWATSSSPITITQTSEKDRDIYVFLAFVSVISGIFLIGNIIAAGWNRSR